MFTLTSSDESSAYKNLFKASTALMGAARHTGLYSFLYILRNWVTGTDAQTTNLSEFRVNTGTISNQESLAIAGLSTGDFVVVWSSDLQDGSNTGVYGQRYASTGTALGSEFRVNTWTNGTQEDPAIAGLSTGDFVVV